MSTCVTCVTACSLCKNIKEKRRKVTKCYSKYPDVANVLKIIFNLNPGQANIEICFNDNILVLKDNLKNELAIAQRFLKNSESEGHSASYLM